MLTDRYNLALSTASAAARDAYVQASHLALTFYPGAAEAYDRAIAADPGFALAHAGKAQVLIRQGDVAAAREALGAAKDVATGLSEREASHIGFFDLVFAGRTGATIATSYAHLTAWPRDALVVASAANPNGVIGGSGRIGQKHQIATLMDSLAPHYGDDFWFLSYHAMGLSEDGQLALARKKIEKSLAANPNNAHGAHGFAHVCYESGDLEAARIFLSTWLAAYPREGFFYGHLSWHLSLCEIQAGNWARASQVYRDGIGLDRHSGGPQQKISDGAAFLWRSELAGHPRDAAAWRALYGYANNALPRPGSGLAACTSSWRRPSWAMTPRSMPVLAKWRNWREEGVTRLALTFRPWRAALRRSNTRTFPRRSRRSPRWQGKTNALAVAARSTT
jgi:tetratricopeptide (TPR) repeat protein